MSSTCKSDHDPNHRILVNRAGYGDQYYKRVKSNSPFSKPVKSGVGEVRVVDTKSCRQLYLRSAYTFTRQDEDNNNNQNNKVKVKERAKKCLGTAQHRVALLLCKRRSSHDTENKTTTGLVIFKTVKRFSCVSLLSLVRRMLACSVKVDVASHYPPSDQFPPLPWKYI